MDVRYRNSSKSQALESKESAASNYVLEEQTPN
jgi:hypothetical protein